MTKRAGNVFFLACGGYPISSHLCCRGLVKTLRGSRITSLPREHAKAGGMGDHDMSDLGHE
jgi:hypothetical protein